MSAGGLVGGSLGPFAILELLGTGGFATVYRAHDPRLQSDVAIKILADNHSLDPDTRERFIAEGHLLRRIGIGSTVQVFDIGETDRGNPYLVLELADRGDLRSRVADRRAAGWTPTVDDVGLLVDALNDALGGLHAEHIVHRDLKPENLLIRSTRRPASRPGDLIAPDERLLVADLGLAKDLAMGSGITVGAGSAAFAAPEQLDAAATVDERADLYAASAVVAWLLTGNRPTAGWETSLSEGWRPLVAPLLRAMQIDPRHRPADVDRWFHDVRAGLDAVRRPSAPFVAAPVTEDAPVAAPEPPGVVAPSVPDGAPSTPGRRRTPGPIAVVAMLAVLALAAGLAVMMLGANSSRDSESATSPAGSPAPAAVEEAELESIDTDEAQVEQTASTAAAADEPAPVGGEEIAVEDIAMREFDMHPIGLQAQLRQLDLGAQTVATVRFVNGRDLDTTLRNGATIVDSGGDRYEALETEDVAVAGAAVSEVDYRFERLDDALAPFTLLINENNDDPDGTDSETVSPSFQIGPFDPVAQVESELSELPEPQGLAIDAAAEGAQIDIDGVAYSETAIGLSVVLTNNTSRQVDFARGRSSTALFDDLGNRYHLELAVGESSLRVDEATSVAGTMVFAGAIDPDASQLTLRTNVDGIGTQPKLEVGPFAVGEPNPAPGPPIALVVDETIDHPTGATVTVERIDFTDAGAAVDIVVTNRRAVQVWLNLGRNTYITDDTGRRLFLRMLISTDSFIVAENAVFDGTLFFPGTIAADATTITLSFNDGEDAERDPTRSNFPEFQFGPYEIEAGAAEPGTPPVDFGQVSVFETTPLARSTGEQVELTPEPEG